MKSIVTNNREVLIDPVGTRIVRPLPRTVHAASISPSHFLPVVRMDHPAVQLGLRSHGRARQGALYVRQAVLARPLRDLPWPIHAHPVLARAPLRAQGLVRRARGEVHQHADHSALHRLPAVLGQRDVVVVPRDRPRVPAVGAQETSRVVQEGATGLWWCHIAHTSIPVLTLPFNLCRI